ncbi:MAG: S-adenosylmethionine:tRNA ribosyltransferase-isomerase [Bacteroidetes bacterium]|nr:S-adenosylmethionine:tRNA ribosyltransferase-isomerase [Bacteroidota bacterium]
MHPKNINIQDFTYQLPEERIAKYPLKHRDASKLLIYSQRSITENTYSNIAQYLPEKSFLLFNDTKVIEARILFQKPTGGIIEIFCLEPHEQYADITTAMMQHENVRWKCLIGGASKWKKGQVLEKKIEYRGSFISLHVHYIEKRDAYFIIEFDWLPADLSFAEILHHAGLIPLPPYIKREVDPSDAERYQTIYANHHGSVAAPTAGLHFTADIFKKLQQKNIVWDFVTLHVGAGTFQPVKTDKLEHHSMHGEFIEVTDNIIQKILENPGQMIIAVGTTSLRTIESLFWLGVKIILQPDIETESLVIQQWDVYELSSKDISVKKSLEALLEWLHKKQIKKIITKTHLLIAPGYEFKIIGALITNFHQPQSTLLLLVAALIGVDWRRVYQYAMDNDFRFLSYGDGCLLFKN